MPTFDFQCKACQAVFEHTRPFGSKEHPACPQCRSKRTEKLLTPPAIHFKGSGFYKTDSGVKSTPKKKSEVAKETADVKAETKAESKKEAQKSGIPPAQTSEKKV